MHVRPNDEGRLELIPNPGIPYTRPVLPPIGDIQQALASIWESGHLTNFGPVQRQFEFALRNAIGGPFIATVSNGWSALRLALASLDLEGEIVIAGFTHPATAQAAASLGLLPVPADIDLADLNISLESVERSITSGTSAILATHIFGNPVDILALESLARRRGLKLVFDSAAAAGSKYHDRALGDYGNASAFSFHATKILSSIEGGAVVSNEESVVEQARRLSNFGIREFGTPSLLGMNGKLSELASAVGMASTKLLKDEITARATVHDTYHALLQGEDNVVFVACREGGTPNNATVAVRLSLQSRRVSDTARRVSNGLSQRGIESRTYFSGKYAVGLATGHLPGVTAAVGQVLCLPCWGKMPASDVETVCQVLKQLLQELEMGRSD